MEAATTLPDVQLIELTPRIAIVSTKLPGNFRRDPADQIIVATAQVYNLELLTADERILKYDHICTV
ncbi:PIN domain-containing protein [Thermodesulfovibrionales bacterium]|nr:PIN domain-containing protein [Thermodesulfovibrionales bacterium]